jgi:hypothetical protein
MIPGYDIEEYDRCCKDANVIKEWTLGGLVAFAGEHAEMEYVYNCKVEDLLNFVYDLYVDELYLQRTGEVR